MANWTEIANLALARLGEDRVNDLDEDESEVSEAILSVRDLVRDQVLRKHPWNCALVRTTLAPDEDAPEWGYTYQYTMPPDPYCLRVWQLDPDSHPQAKWAVKGRKIQTDEGPVLYVEYISRIADPEQFDAALVEALAAHLAEAVAWRLTNSRTAEREMKDWAKKSLPDARGQDAQEGTADDVEDSDFLASRV